ncbi:unnamed protein product [Rotaria sp. Silwood1]|nr:unnamed protein product [Rotaria sp. Silwood1]
MQEKRQKRASSSESDDSDDDFNDLDDELSHFEDVSHLTSLLKSTSPTEKLNSNSIPVVDSFSSINIGSALDVSSHLSSGELKSLPLFNDSIRSYIGVSSLFQTTTDLSPYYLSIDPTANQSSTNPYAPDRLYVGNVSYSAGWRDVRDLFTKLSYHVIRVDLPNSQKTQGHRGCAFVRFDSESTVEKVLSDFGEVPGNFVLGGRRLKIDRCKKPRQQMKATIIDSIFNENTASAVSFSIENVHYGTFIMEVASSTITGFHTAGEYALIAHPLLTQHDNTSVSLRIDEQDRKVSIIVSYEPSVVFGSSNKYTFEWNFGALKGEKISPVLINDSIVGLLIEVKQPPLILHSYSNPLSSEVYDTRMPGTPLIGHANAWLFRLAGQKLADDYIKLFQLLRRYNLTPRRFFEQHILRMIQSLRSAREYLRHVQLLSNEQWINENREIVSRFLDYRWPQYPFETKYEIMKLLSKHIITIHDLIIDEQLDKILAKCSLNTFIACTDKIVELAPRWLHETCDHEDENSDDDEQAKREEDQSSGTKIIESSYANCDDVPSVTVHSAIGTSIDATNTEQIFLTNNINRLNVSVQKHHLGYLSRFLILALKQLQNKHELRQTTIGGVYVTKHELHTIHSSSSFIRKVYITPSTILYEGPYREEKCLVTRHFEKQQDRFLRVSFRDENYRKLQYTNADMSKLYDCIKAILINGIGMVCLDIAQRIVEPDVGLYLRPSMNKFDSNNRSIDIVRVSSMPSVGFLNRQIILLLSSLGIRDEIFYSMQEQMLEHLRTLTVDHRKAREFLKQFGASSGNGYHGFLLEYLKRFGNCIDPFVRHILIAVQAFHVKELRTKTRILVPNTWSLFGVVDETGTLRYGEVFIQIEQKPESGDYSSKIITGPVIVTRNPCFHPGDIRRLNAVNVPALHGLKNVIVFPMNGEQSHPAEMSGGDLDGDIFWVSHEQRLLFENNEKPFDYHDQAIEDAIQMQLDTNITFGINDICKFFIEYIEADNLGMIANSHLAFADQSLLRAKAKECLQLARMHSTAVDFAKNGVSAQRLTTELRPSKYPHFMENRQKLSYRSQTILGQLYDEVERFEIDLIANKEQNIINTSSFPYYALVVDGSDAFMAAASTTKNEYNLELKRIMRQYGIRREAELVSGYILKFTTKQYLKQANTFELRNEIMHGVKIIQDK